MNNLITNNSNILNADESKNNGAKKPSTPEFYDKFNKIFQNAKNRQNELTNRSPQMETARKNTPVKNFLTEIKDVVAKKEQKMVADDKNKSVEKEDVEKTKETAEETTNNGELTEKALENSKQTIKDLEKLATDLLNTPDAQNTEILPEVTEEIAANIKEVADKILQMQNEGVEIPDELLKKIDELSQKITAGTLNATDIKQLGEELKVAILDIKNILKNAKITDTSTLNTAVSEIALQGGVQSGILVDEKNIKTSSGQTITPAQQEGEVNVQQTVEQKILDELNLNVDEVIVAAPTTEVAPKTTTNASEQLIKLSIEKVSTPIEGGAGAQNSNSQMNNQNFSAQTAQNNQTQTVKAETASAPRFVDVNKTDILNQIGSKFEQLKDGSNSRITLTLRPNDLGRVVIELSHGANGVTTNIVAQNQSVKETLEKNIEGLKQQLAAAGVNVQNINVKTAEFNPQGGFEDTSGQNSEGNNQSYSGGGSSSSGSEENSTNQGGNFEQEASGNEEESLITHNGEINYKI